MARRIGFVALAALATTLPALVVKMAPTSANTTGVEFGLERGYGPTNCNTVIDGKAGCTFDQYGLPFTIRVVLHKAAGLGNNQYYKIGFTLAYTGVYPQSGSWLIDWPGCQIEQTSSGAGFVHAECEGSPSNFTGQIGRVNFVGPADGEVTLVHGANDTFVVDGFGVSHGESGPDVMNLYGFDSFVTTTPTATRTPRPGTPTPPPVGGDAALTGAMPPKGRSGPGALALVFAGTACVIALAGAACWYGVTRRAGL